MNSSEILDTLSTMNWRKFFTLLVVTVFLGGAAAVYESYTHHFELARVGRALDLASRAESLRASISISSDPLQLETYRAAAATAHDAVLAQGIHSPLSERYVKLLCAFIPWFFMALVYVGGKDGARYIGMFGAIFIGAIVSSALSFVPNIIWPIGSLVLLPCITWLLVVGAFGFFKRGRRGVA